MPRPSNSYSFTEESPCRTSIHSVPFYYGLLVVLFYSSLYGFVCVVDNMLPTPLTVNNENDYPNSFIAERAARDLKNLTDIGPKITGSYENEFIAVEYLTKRINYIVQQAHRNQFIEQDLQEVTGSYYLNKKAGVINSYDNVQNIVVKLHGSNASNSVLVNSHFDSVPTSPGASDDGINVSVMLEILRLMSQATERPVHNIIFLFNGAEETPLQASHGFITKHKWADSCKVVLNLDAAGSGGKIILFQTGPGNPWLVKYYSRVPHPYGQAAGEELFQSGVIPSDTDFRIFRDFGELVGLDMAFIQNGYRYHTKYDAFSYIPSGSFQHVGDNTLYLVKALGNAPELDDDLPFPGKPVYYDILGLFMITYSQFSGLIINSFAIVLSLVMFVYSMFSLKIGFSKSTLKFMALSFGAILGSWVIAGLFVFVFAVILDLLGKTMTWFSIPWLVYGLYSIPTIGFSGSLLFITNHENIAINIRGQIQLHMLRLIWTIILITGVYFDIRASYALMIPVLNSTLAVLINHLLRLEHTVKLWQIVYVIALIPSTVNLMYQSLIVFTLFVPLTGRMGPDKNPDLIIGFMTFFFTLIISSPLTAMTNTLRNAKYYFICLALVFLGFLCLVFTNMGFPYKADIDHPTPQRQWIMHTSRKFHNETGALTKTDAGFFFLNMDRNSPRILKKYVKSLDNAVSTYEDCDYIGCGLPIPSHVILSFLDYNTWVPAGQPILPQSVNLVADKNDVSSTEMSYSISVSGPDRLTLYLIPKLNVSFLNISLVDNVDSSTTRFNDRPVYFIYHQRGKSERNFNFSCNVQVPEDWEGPTVDISVVGRYVHPNKMHKTPQFLELIEQMPGWADVITSLGASYFYVI